MPQALGPSSTMAGMMLLGLALTGQAAAGTLATLYSFSGGADGSLPNGSLIAGPNGSLIGTTSYGGTGSGYSGNGTVFQLLPPGAGQTAWTLNTLYTFKNGSDGADPWSLAADSSGNIYGETDVGGTFNGMCDYGTTTDYGCGTIFRLSPPANGKTAWTFTTIYSFNGSTDGAAPQFGLTLDAHGTIYGVTGFGGIFNGQCMEYYGDGGCGTVFTLSPPAQGQTAWTKQIIYDFKGNADGFGPEAPLLVASGKIFGGTFFGGDMNSADCMQQHGCGLIYQLTPPATGKTAWSKKTILAFKGPNGSNPQGGLTIDASGNLYGNGQAGGNEKNCLPGSPFPNGCGAVFELSPPAGNATEWTDLTVFRFTNGADSSFPWDPPVQQGTSYFMTTSGDEVKSFGSIVALIPPAGAQTKWKEKTAFAFSNDANGCSPLGTLLLLDKTFYATTAGDGNGPAAWGTVFSYKP